MKKLLIITLFVANAGCKKDPPSVTPDPPPSTYTITASAGTNGSVTPTSMTVNSGGTATFTFVPEAGYRLSSITVDGITTLDSTSYSITLKNVKATHSISATFTDSLLQSQLDSIKKLIIGEWIATKLEYKPTGDVFTDWYGYPIPTCEADDWEVYTATSYEAHQNGTLCSGGFPTDVYYVGTWRLSPTGKETILTLTEGGTVLSSELVSVTKDTMVSIFVDTSTHYSWKYTSVHHSH